MTATSAPRLQIDNGIKIFHHDGSLYFKKMFDKLYQADWKPEAPERFGDIADLVKSVHTLNINETRKQAQEPKPSQSFAKTPTSTMQKPAAYCPPHAKSAAAVQEEVVNANVSLNCLEELFLSEERVLLPNPPLEPGLPAISIRNGYFSWDSKADSPTLSDINLDVPVGSLVAIVGSTGEGKTSLLSAMLGELPPMPETSTSVVIQGTVAYVPQVSWIFNATARDNILFGSPFQRSRYEKAVEVTALQHDLDLLLA